MITTQKASYGNLIYTVEKIWNPFCLIHSEWIWLLINEVHKSKGISYEKIKRVIKEYQQSELYNEIVYHFNGNEHLQLLYKWFGEKWGVNPIVEFDEEESKVTVSLGD
ncbi:hypothetical protein [Paenibacillus ferrarius]|uniref:hypothetical protein n=1 Tax=Paenibacillus ferrarius TaxID=1469647 RepID=UPI00117D1017|nr:hypothetical protein [Paenibacillus ferrarius]